MSVRNGTLWRESAAGLAARLARRELSAREATEVHLARIAEAEAALSAFITVAADEALSRADALDAVRRIRRAAARRSGGGEGPDGHRGHPHHLWFGPLRRPCAGGERHRRGPDRGGGRHHRRCLSGRAGGAHGALPPLRRAVPGYRRAGGPGLRRAALAERRRRGAPPSTARRWRRFSTTSA